MISRYSPSGDHVTRYGNKRLAGPSAVVRNGDHLAGERRRVGRVARRHEDDLVLLAAGPRIRCLACKTIVSPSGDQTGPMPCMAANPAARTSCRPVSTSMTRSRVVAVAGRIGDAPAIG